MAQEYVRLDGTRVPVETTAVAIRYQGSDAHLVLVRDITERKRAEEALLESEKRFRTLFENALDANLLLIDGIHVDCNQAALAMLGGDREQVVGHSVLESSPEFQPDGSRSADKATAYIREAMETGGKRFEWVHRRLDGTEFWAEVVTTSLMIGGRRALFGTWRDITNRKRAEEELARYRNHLEELVEQRTREVEAARELVRQSDRLASLGTFAAGIAHEINNPLGMMMLGTEQALANIDTPEVAGRLLRQSTALIERCGHIVRGVLDFSRKASTGKRPLDLSEIVRQGVEFIRESAAKHGVTVEIRPAEKLGPILGNTVELTQVVVNLVQNAVQACAQGGHVTIETGNTEGKVRLAVQDDGCGMKPEDAHRIFDPFFTTRLTNGGTGLGLSVVHGIIKAPSRSPAKRDEARRSPSSSDSAPKRRRAMAKVLVVDDEPVYLELLSTILRADGYEVFTAETGESAVEIARGACPDVLLADWRLQGRMTGIDVARELRTQNTRLGIVMITGYSAGDLSNEAKGLDGLRVLTKPFGSDAVRHLVHEAAERTGGSLL
jgi:PAS domain S-box-containing protein